MGRATGMPQRRGLARKEPALSGPLGPPGRNAQPRVGLDPKREVVDVLCLEWQDTQLKAVLVTLRKGKTAQRELVEDGESGKSGRHAVLHAVGGRRAGRGCVVFCQETQGNAWAKGSRRRNVESRFAHRGHPGETGEGAVQPVEEEPGRGGASVNPQVMPASVKAFLLSRESVKVSHAKSRSGANGEGGGRAQGAADLEERLEGGDVPLQMLQGLACSTHPVLGLGRRRGCAERRIALGLDARISTHRQSSLVLVDESLHATLRTVVGTFSAAQTTTVLGRKTNNAAT